MRAEATTGWPEPLGVSPDGDGVNVAIPAPGAWSVTLCVFDAADREVAQIRLPGRCGEVHHGHVAGLRAGTRYGLRVDGSWEPGRGHRFNPAKLLLDPWARALDRPFHLHPSLFDTGEVPDPADSAPHMPKALVAAPLPEAPHRPPPRGPQVLYELHVKGFTARHPEVPEALRGTFAGLAHPAAIAHLRQLGVTTLKLMPAAAWIDERHLGPLGLTNYWGYNPVALLAPDPRLAPGGMAEVRAAVASLQDAGFAVLQDVVFNHDGEGDHLGPTLSLKGLGNAAWFRLRPDDARRYANDSGCGNTLALDRPWPLRLVMDALRHWVGQAGLDGVRLDLAATMGRREHGFDPAAPLLSAMRQDPLLRERMIVAEPWDIGEGGYRLGHFPPGWPEWNDRFRDDVRRFWRGDGGMVGALATRLAGSTDIFPDRPLTDSVNFVAAHDGFTLADLVSFTAKRNLANGEQNRDGSDGNNSWNNGTEGPSEDASVLARRAADRRALLATLLTARGTPMLAMGDECGRSQGGNNNAYAQDNATTWFDWAGREEALQGFATRLIAARLAHPALHGAIPLTGGAPADALPDVAWLRPQGGAMAAEDWSSPESRALVAVFTTPGDRCLLALNAGEALPLALPPPRRGHRWRLLADSADPSREGVVDLPLLPARAVLLLAEEALPGSPRGSDATDLARLARVSGIATLWRDLEGTRHEVPAETLRALLGALGVPADGPAMVRDSLATLSAPPGLPPSLTLRGPGTLPLPLADRPVMLRLRTEDGEEQRIPVAPDAGSLQRLTLADGRAAARRLVALPPLPPGRHLLFDEAAPDRACHLTIAPPSCHLPPALAEGGRRFGVMAQLYALRHGRDQGIGDFTALAELAHAAQAEGAAYLGLSPAHALFPDDRGRASPYHPSDRRFLDPIFLDVAALPMVGDLPAVRAVLAAQQGIFAALRAGETVDHAAAWRAKADVLAAAWEALPEAHPAHTALAAFQQEQGAALAGFCAFTLLAERLGTTDARRWPAEFRDGTAPGVAGFLAAHRAQAGAIAFQQFLADAQLAAAGRAGAPLYRDLAVGAAPDGAEIWSGEGRFLPGFSIGAPPDPFAAAGQVWGLPPPDPRAAEANGHAAFGQLIRANMRHAGALRVDHVLGLRRLFVVPEGAPASAGTYLDQPFAAQLGVLALESQRAGCLVIGEDLGTVPEGMGEALHAAEVQSYRVLWFERQGRGFQPPRHWPARAAACVSTHDLATLAGFWAAADLAEREALGLLPDPAAAARERAADRATLLEALATEGLLPPGASAEGPMDDALAAAIHAFVASTPAALLLVQAEDLAGETIAVNLPGTDRERPNWRRRLPQEAATLTALPRARAILASIRPLRGQ